jgi:hypothetical protein
MITLREPTAPMVKEAASADFLTTPFGKFPRLQIVTVSDLLDGKLPKLPPQELAWVTSRPSEKKRHRPS